MINSGLNTCLNNTIHFHKDITLSNILEDNDEKNDADNDIYDYIALGAIIGVLISIVMYILT